MPDMKEKLVELLEEIPHPQRLYPDLYVDRLTAHGVTVLDLDGCKYCKEDSDGYRTMFGAFSIANPCHGNVWTINTGHCKPQQIYFCPMCGRRLPQPPKGE